MTRPPLRIEGLAAGGAGVGRQHGQVVFVPGTAPGDLVRWRPRQERRRFIEAELEEILEAGEGRVTPVCPLFGRCGGCQWQHLAYPLQTSWKQRLVHESLTRIGGLVQPAVLDTVAAPAPLGYRTRAQFKCRLTEQGFVTGFYRRGSHFVIDLPPAGCPICHPLINRALAEVRPLLAASSEARRIPQLDLETDDEGRVRVVVHRAEPGSPEFAAPLADLARRRGWGLFLQQGRKSTLLHLAGPAELIIHPLADRSLSLGYGPGGFAQINLEQNRSLVAAVLAAADLRGSETILDLFCGNGNFSLPLARLAGRVAGVEAYPPSIAAATANAARHGLVNTRFEVADVEFWLSSRAGLQPDLVILDPPRDGAGAAAVTSLARVRPARILYVSCDPGTLARDLALLGRQGFGLIWCQPYDLFPQTAHVESLSLLEPSPV